MATSWFVLLLRAVNQDSGEKDSFPDPRPRGALVAALQMSDLAQCAIFQNFEIAAQMGKVTTEIRGLNHDITTAIAGDA
jgi:hypothetical protein